MHRTRSALIALALVAACSPPDDEGQLRELIAAMETAAEARNTGYFRSLIAAEYADRSGRRRDQTIDLIRGFFLVNSTVEVVTRIARIEIVTADVAEVELQVAIVGSSGGALGLDADFRTLRLELVRGSSGWQVIGSDWERAGQR